MKPKDSNRIMCPDCKRAKMLFETEAKAKRFIEYNGDEIDTGGKPPRAYYCSACGGWHITHQPERKHYNGTERLISAYNRDRHHGNIDIRGKKQIAY